MEPVLVVQRSPLKDSITALEERHSMASLAKSNRSHAPKNAGADDGHVRHARRR
jgi:hypothetical protein